MEQVNSVLTAAGTWLGVPSDMTPWDWMNSEVVVAFMVLFFGLIFRGKVARLTEDADHAAEKRRREVLAEKDSLARAEDDLEALVQAPRREGQPPEEHVAVTPAPVPGRVASANRLQHDASLIVNEAKKLVDARLDRQSDPRKKRGYDFLGIRDYRLRVIAAREDRLINEAQAMMLRELFEAWHPHRDGSAIVTQELVDHLTSLLDAAKQAGHQELHHRRTHRGTTV